MLCLSAHTVGKGYLDAVTLMWSPCLSSTRPSNEAHDVARELNGTQIRGSIVSGSGIGRKYSVSGQIGEMGIAGISGCTSGPPAENE